MLPMFLSQCINNHISNNISLPEGQLFVLRKKCTSPHLFENWNICFIQTLNKCIVVSFPVFNPYLLLFSTDLLTHVYLSQTHLADCCISNHDSVHFPSFLRISQLPWNTLSLNIAMYFMCLMSVCYCFSSSLRKSTTTT